MSIKQQDELEQTAIRWRIEALPLMREPWTVLSLKLPWLLVQLVGAVSKGFWDARALDQGANECDYYPDLR